MTQQPSRPPTALPPDPEAYDSPRAARAREKGLPTPYIAGGADPDPSAGLAEERRYGKLLLWMVAAIVAVGFVVGLIVALFQST
ncbi:MAG: flagellar biosynthetic protein FliQ [Candidatus Limnocylindrales bacterium]